MPGQPNNNLWSKVLRLACQYLDLNMWGRSVWRQTRRWLFLVPSPTSRRCDCKAALSTSQRPASRSCFLSHYRVPRCWKRSWALTGHAAQTTLTRDPAILSVAGVDQKLGPGHGTTYWHKELGKAVGKLCSGIRDSYHVLYVGLLAVMVAEVYLFLMGFIASINDISFP